MKKGTKAIGFGLGLAGMVSSMVGCATDAERAPTVRVTNISTEDIAISSDQVGSDQETKVGVLGAGEAAVADCVNYDPEYPQSTTVHIIVNNLLEGYVFVHTPYDKNGNGGERQLNPSVDELHQRLHPCSERLQ